MLDEKVEERWPRRKESQEGTIPGALEGESAEQGLVNDARCFWEVNMNRDGKKAIGLGNQEVTGDIRGKSELQECRPQLN